MYKIAFTYIFVIVPLLLFSQETVPKLQVPDVQQLDTVYYEILPSDTLQPDTIQAADTLAVGASKAPIINAPIDYNAEDSIIVSFDGQKVFMFNNAKLNYQQIELTAYYIQLDLETKEVYAEGLLDATGTLIQKPVFKDGKQEFESKTLRYNFQTEKGIITDVVTEQGEGYVHSERTKKISKDAFLLTQGKYTTCDADHPHFYLHLSKAKVYSGKKIITGRHIWFWKIFPFIFLFYRLVTFQHSHLFFGDYCPQLRRRIEPGLFPSRRGVLMGCRRVFRSRAAGRYLFTRVVVVETAHELPETLQVQREFRF